MSYICLIANKTGISLAGDSRITLQPAVLGLHLSGRKVFALPERRMVWGCCGLLCFGGIHLPTAAGWVLRNPNQSLATALRRIGDLAACVTRVFERLHGREGCFTLLVGQMTEQGPDVRRLAVRGGTVTVARCVAPVLLEEGWYPRQYPKKPEPERLAREDVMGLSRIAVQRVQTVIRLDKEQALEHPDCRQTVGGSVRCVYVEREA